MEDLGPLRGPRKYRSRLRTARSMEATMAVATEDPHKARRGLKRSTTDDHLRG